MLKALDPRQLKELLTDLQEDYMIIAPFKVKQGEEEKVLYRRVKSADEISSIYLDEQPDASPKDYYMPRDDKLGDETRGPEYEPEDWTDKPRLFVGVRSCDVEGIKLFDDVFLSDDYLEPFYQSRRENSMLIGYSCSQPSDYSFCQELGFDPVFNEDVPVYLLQSDDKFYLYIDEENADEIFLQQTDDLPEAEESWQELISRRREELSESGEFELEGELPYPEMDIFHAVDWEKPTASCLGCGVCTFYCPTCFCFKFFWEGTEKSRAWDSCMFSLFTAQGSGHNPREEQDQRWRQRLMHKFSYHPQHYDGAPGCVGCGRCVQKCPVNLDIRDVLYEVETTLAEKGGN